MLQIAITILKWVSVPTLLTVSVFSSYAANYELLFEFVFCLGAIILSARAIRLEEYFWASGLVVIAVAFSPLILVAKIFLLMSLGCIASIVTLFETLRPHAALPRQPR